MNYVQVYLVIRQDIPAIMNMFPLVYINLKSRNSTIILPRKHLRRVFFICWITFHFQEVQSAAIRKNVKIKMLLGQNFTQFLTNCKKLTIFLKKALMQERSDFFLWHFIILQLSFDFFFFFIFQNQSAVVNVVQLIKKEMPKIFH